MSDISGITTALQIFLIPFVISLLIWLEDRKLDKKSLKTFIVSFSIFFVLSHILSYLMSYPESYLPSYLILFIYLIITQKKNFKIYEIIIYFDFFIIFQAVLYLIIYEVRFQLGYEEPDAFIFYLFLSGIFSYLFSFVGCLFAAFMQVLEQVKKKF